VQFQRFDYPDIQRTLEETFSIWSAGLSRENYYLYNMRQRQSLWGRRNLSVMGLKDAGRVLGSLKCYRLDARTKSQSDPIFGLGAMYIREKYRGHGLGAAMLEAFEKYAMDEGARAIMLFSDIGTEFYEQAGYQPMSSLDFELLLPPDWPMIQAESKIGIDKESYRVVPFVAADYDVMDRHYRRWLANRDCGIERSAQYFKFKAEREDFLFRHSRRSWPSLQVLSYGQRSYAIFEAAGRVMRVLEACAPQSEREQLWHALLDCATHLKCNRLRGWEGVLADLSPSYNLNGILSSYIFRSSKASISYTDRLWGEAMILPLCNKLDEWPDCFPCPILELDHL
jgi:predicted N-acetyltransferase YhbS